MQLKVSAENRLHLLSYRSMYICDLLILQVFFSQMYTFNLQSQIDQLVNTVRKTFCLTFNVTNLDVGVSGIKYIKPMIRFLRFGSISTI